jgi:hypothetical protein
MPDESPKPKTHFGDSNEVDPTPGWIPFFFVIGIAILFLIGFVAVAIFWR